jgi:peptidoglycan hydrolase-like protein with peptidoglycan-binding domain
MPYQLIWLPQVLRAAGLKVAETPGWADRGRGEMGDVRGVVCHHTATATAAPGNMPSLALLIQGRSDLPGPLAQLGLGRDGTFYVIAAGRANHAGEGAWAGVSGNSRFIGIEGENAGTREAMPWPDVQMDAYRRGVAAILRKLGTDESMCCGHREYAPKRKIDTLFDMDEFRSSVRALLQGTGATRPLIPALDANGRPTLQRGARGDDVTVLQTTIGVVPPDGVFGPNTEAALRAWQRTHELVPDGICGPATWKSF